MVPHHDERGLFFDRLGRREVAADHQFVASGYFVVCLQAGPKADEAIRSSA
jgi:hypothetical protein